jgi:uncharacterized protein YjbJ (UPF0337 family)
VSQDILKGKWKELKGQVKARWGKLTDDDLGRIEGRRDQMIGLLQQRYGYAKREAEEELDDFVNGLSAQVSSRERPG